MMSDIESRAEATIVLYRHPKPLEYGLVMTKPDGRIERFIESPHGVKYFAIQFTESIFSVLGCWTG